MSNYPKSNLKVLVADDSQPIRLVLKTYLKQIGITPDFAVNGAEALACIMNNEFDLAFIDINMPEMNGTEVVKKVRKEGRTFPILAITTPENNADFIEYLNCGFNSFLNKPLKKNELLDKIDKYTH